MAEPGEEAIWRSDTIPSPEQVGNLRAQEEQYSRSLDALNGEIAELEQRLEELKIERLRGEIRLGKIKSALSLHKRLPPELLGLIFQLAVGEDRYWIPRNGHRSTYPEHVCTRWRAIALATPELYKMVHVNYGVDCLFESEDELQKAYDLTTFTEGIMSRGTIELQADFEYLPEDIAIEFMKRLLLPSLEFLLLSHCAATRQLFNNVVAVLPQCTSLKHMVMWFSDLRDGSYGPGELDVGISNTLSEKPWTQLTRLDLGDGNMSCCQIFLPPDSALFLLLRCPELRHCSLNVRSSATYPSANPQLIPLLHDSITHPHLENLNLSFYGQFPEDDFSKMLRGLVCPGLHTLKLNAINGLDEIRSADLLDFLDRSRCNLVDLVTVGVEIPPDDLEVLLASLTTIQNIVLNSPCLFDVPHLNQIASGEFLPNLVQLKGCISGLQHVLDAVNAVASALIRRPKRDDQPRVIQLKYLPQPEVVLTLDRNLVDQFEQEGGYFRLEQLPIPFAQPG